MTRMHLPAVALLCAIGSAGPALAQEAPAATPAANVTVTSTNSPSNGKLVT